MTDRPLPFPRGEERVFFDAAREGHLSIQRCEDCSVRIGYPRAVCPNCLSDRLIREPSAGAGVVHSFTTLHRSGNPAMADRVPYTIVLVDLDEGVRVLADLVDAPDPVVPEIGMRVQAVFEDLSADISIPRFQRAEAVVR